MARILRKLNLHLLLDKLAIKIKYRSVIKDVKGFRSKAGVFSRFIQESDDIGGCIMDYFESSLSLLVSSSSI
ncbi:MAG: hypothetical protein DRJ11_06020 [Candidatus Aminicenantes bacterium]|nr:MAG: hypothetical protein DRJ11_06020 [Candidatus Aminicenantes bacterium]